ncbi:MAG: hypothetical protein HY896_03725 [Deltaproteobacteria bacterium]|nr:hypothetical protein [Deltaproteobacteria bacterium]
MTDYCIVPPYVIQNVQPNVMIVVDTSGSMFNMAYYDGFNRIPSASDNDCSLDQACSGFLTPGTYPDYKYYGYFNPDYWYTYDNSGNKFVQSVTKVTRSKNSSEWDGNFLNWLTMRRVDIIRKVLTGGKRAGGEGTGWDKVEGEKSDCEARGVLKQFTDNQSYTPYNGAKTYTFNYQSGSCNGSGSGTSTFTISGVSGTFYVRVRVPSPVQGVLQDVVGSRARIGLTFYKVNDASGNNEGGRVRVNVGSGSLSSTVNEINNTRPFTNTPLGETLYTAMGYFAQQASMHGGPGPRYETSDYNISSSADPMNYGTGTPRYPVCQKSFVLYITDGEPCGDGNMPAIMVNYASGRSNYNCEGESCPAVSKPITGGQFSSSSFGSCGAGGYTAGMEDVALYMHTNDLRSDIGGTQNITLYNVFAFGKGSTLLRYAAINGGFQDNASCTANNQSCWDTDLDGEPDTFYEANDGNELEQAIRNAFASILKRASSGTAASVLASGEGSGANLIQAVFYPRRAIGDDIVWWAGALQNQWYYVDPFFANATIREETTGDNILNLRNDDILQFYFNPVTQLTEVRLWDDSNGDGIKDTQPGPNRIVRFEDVSSLWEAGKKLWERDLASNPRTIKTSVSGTALIDFSVANASTLSPYILPDTGDNVVTIINYVNGIDNTDDWNLRRRTVSFGGDNSVWRLGDIVNSTPRIVAGIQLNKYDSVYSDTTYKSFIDNTAYKNRGMVFTGGNDGMLHAFRLGKLELNWDGKQTWEKARITNPYTGTILGDEAWAFIPRNALPYLKYLKDPDYCHLYYVDLTPYVFDASIQGNTTDVRTAESWRTILIAGMRFGGACENATTCSTGEDCVKTPAADKGFSSYFAMDVTDPTTPTLLWEFSNVNIPDAVANGGLGFTTTGPAIVRINAVNPSTGQRDRSRNGEWYVVFGSGPTGPIDTANNQFLGRSNQQLRFFVLNLETGALVQTITPSPAITYAFAGSMINSVADFNIDYQDDAIYVGYVKRTGSGSNYSWTQGGVGRIVTKNVTPSNSPGAGWVFNKVIDDIGPVTSYVARLQNKNYSQNWLYFGTGRYFFEVPPSGSQTSPTIDDETNQRRLFAVKDPCFTQYNTINDNCTTTIAFPPTDNTFRNVTDNNSVPSELTASSASFKGWYIDLDPSSTIDNTMSWYTYDNVARPYRAERVITDPLATTSGIVFFTTFKPYADECALGGKSFIWATRYNTGGAPKVLKGQGLVQVSTASVEQVDLSSAFSEKGGRRTSALEGVPPTAQGLSLLSQPPPVKRILHMRER